MHDPASGPPLRRPGPPAVRKQGRLRPAVEDLLGAGAVLDRTERAAGLDRAALSPEAHAALAAFRAAEDALAEELHGCVSGRELRSRGWDDDVAMAAGLDADHAVPVLDGPAYRRLQR